jgi:ATPase components of ABC transporters with duplicated ATPase domains
LNACTKNSNCRFPPFPIPKNSVKIEKANLETDGEIEVKMSILTVQKLSHGFGDRAIFDDVNFRLLKGEHIGFVGANGEGNQPS